LRSLYEMRIDGDLQDFTTKIPDAFERTSRWPALA
jgi:hypothetical protein